jgi:DNA adenine methylase
MRYFGGKQRISKPLSEFINSQLKEGQPFIDAFCGSCNIISKIGTNRTRIANDKHKYLIAMWKGLQEGWVPPTKITKEVYYQAKGAKDINSALTGFAGFGSSFAGKWFGGYAHLDKRTGAWYSEASRNSLLRKFKTLTDVTFLNNSVFDLEIPKGSLVYCDIPYKDTTPYCKKEVGVFDHESFYRWCKVKIKDGCVVYVSEYLQNVPEDATVVWTHKSKKDIRDKNGVQQPTTEVLFTWEDIN